MFARSSLLAAMLLVCLPVTALGAKPAAGKPQPVVVAPVRVQVMADRVEALGTVQANESVTLTANVAEKVAAIHFEDGQAVQAGTILVLLEQAEERAMLEQARAQLGERELALKRLLRLEKQKLAATDELDRARLAVDQARASIAAMQARLDDRVIRAPFTGIVGLRQVSPGGLVESGQAVATLDDIRTVKLDFTLPAIHLHELRPGLAIQARAAALANREYLGEIKTIDNRIDPVTRAIRVRALLDNPDARLLPGMLLNIAVLRNPRDALVIPEAALLPLGEQQFVMVRRQKDNTDTVEKRRIEIGTRLPGVVEVTAGLADGEQVVTHGANKLKPGDVVKVQAVDDGSAGLSSIIKGKPLAGSPR